MISRSAILISVVMLASVSSAQGKPVTVGEADAVFAKIENSFRTVLKLGTVTESKPGPNRPITRAEIATRLDNLFVLVKPKFEFTPRPYRVKREVIDRFNPFSETQELLAEMVKWGLIAPVGPLVTGSKDEISISEFGTAIGHFVHQVAALTYFADPEWEPNLMPTGIGGG